MKTVDTTLKTIRLNKKTSEHLIKKSRELQITQGSLVTYAFNKLTDTDYQILKSSQELIAA